MAIESTTNVNNNNAENNKSKKNKKNKSDDQTQMKKDGEQEQQSENKSGAKNKNSLNKINRININDLVASVINQHTSSSSSNPASLSLSTSTTTTTGSNYSAPNNYTVPTIANNVTTDSNNNKQSLTVEDFDRLVKTSQTTTTTATIGGIKVTVLGAQEANTSPLLFSPSTISTSSSSSSSSSPSNNSSFNQSEHNVNSKNSSQKVAPQQQHKPQLTSIAGKKFDMSINNPNARAVLEKPQKDLHRQQTTLNKLAGSFHDEHTRSQTAIIQQFNKIRQLIDQRQAFLLAQLNTSSTNGNRLLQQRQSKASDLRVLVDNAVHLNEDEVLELKADIKHFVSERQLDEEMGSVKLFEEMGMDRLTDAISSYGSVHLVQDKYAKQRPPLNELLNDNATVTSTTSSNNQIKSNNKKTTTTTTTKTNNTKMTKTNVDNNNNNRNDAQKQSSSSQKPVAENDNESGFIEVKSKNRNPNKSSASKQHGNNNSNNVTAKLLAQNNFNRLSTVN